MGSPFDPTLRCGTHQLGADSEARMVSAGIGVTLIPEVAVTVETRSAPEVAVPPPARVGVLFSRFMAV
jgi:DNA-binding transcriptional LysR family regulator